MSTALHARIAVARRARWAASIAGMAMTVAIISCGDDPTAPDTISSAALHVGDTARGSLGGGRSTRVFTVLGTAGEEVSVVVSLARGTVEAVLTDSGERQVYAAVRATVGDTAPAGAPQASAGIRLPATGPYRLRLRSTPSGSAADFAVTVAAIDRSPDSARATMAIGDTVGSERLEHAGDIDEYVVSATAGQLAALFIAGPAERGPAIDAVVLDEAGGSVLGAATAPTGAATLDAQGSGLFVFPRTGTYRVRVRGRASSGAFPASYRISLFPIDARPEHVAARLGVRDTVDGEIIAPLGDVDEFILEGAAGDEINVFHQARSGRASDSLVAFLVDTAGTLLAAVRSAGTDTALTRQASGRIRLPHAGSYHVIVRGESDTTAGDLGAYRLHVDRVREAPEVAAASLALGALVADETIEIPGDVDAYAVAVSAPTQVNLELRHRGAAEDSLRGEVVDAAGRSLGAVTVGAARAQGSGQISLPAAGTYVVRVFGASSTGEGFRGRYELVLHHLRGTSPEAAPAAIALGDTIADAIDPPGDEDVYTFPARKRDLVHVHLQGTGTATGYLTATVRDPATGKTLGAVTSRVAEADLAERRTIRLTMPADGTYEVVVSAYQAGRDVGEQGPYRLAALRVPTAPEHAAAALTVGDSIGVEGFDYPGDIDRFMVAGSPGQEVIGYFDYDGAQSSCVRMAVLEASSADSVGLVVSCGFPQSTGRFRLPASGAVTLEIYEPVFCSEFGCHETFRAVGPYRFQLGAVDRGPEVASATISYGDTVSGGWDGATQWGEWVRPIGDIDEFTFTGAAGDTVEVLFQTPNGTWSSGGIRIELIDPRTGAVLGATTSINPDVLGARRIGPLALSSSGTYLIRVVGVAETGGDNRFGSGPYRFVLQRAAAS